MSFRRSSCLGSSGFRFCAGDPVGRPCSDLRRPRLVPLPPSRLAAVRSGSLYRIIPREGAPQAPVKTIESYWPYATTVFDYVRRAMPWRQPKSLTDDEVYAVSAYILNLNGLTPADAVMDALSPLGIKHIDMPLTPGRIWEALRGR